MKPPRFLVSGGQSGVDRGVLQYAVRQGVAYRGWTPAGGWAEDLPDPPGVLALYPALRATESVDPNHRTSLNVEESDALLILEFGAPSPGTDWAEACARSFGKPSLRVSPPGDVEAARAWLAQTPDLVALAIAGPRESEHPGAEAAAAAFLERVFA